MINHGSATPATSNDTMNTETKCEKELEMDKKATPTMSNDTTNLETEQCEGGRERNLARPPALQTRDGHGEELEPFMLLSDRPKPDAKAQKPDLPSPRDMLFEKTQDAHTAKLSVTEVEFLCGIWANLVLQSRYSTELGICDKWSLWQGEIALIRLGYFSEILGRERVKEICDAVYWDFDFDVVAKEVEDRRRDLEWEERDRNFDEPVSTRRNAVPPPEGRWDPGDPPPGHEDEFPF